MNTAARVGAFGAGLAVVFGAALGTGRLAGPWEQAGATAPHAEMAADNHGAMTAEPAGLSATDQGYRLVPGAATITPSTSARVTFRVLDADGQALTAYTTAHEKKLHLIVVRRDLSGFQHVHPTMAADGTWSASLDLSRPGQWRMFADFDPEGPTGGLVLGTDLAVPGDYAPTPVPAPDTTTTAGPFTLRATGGLDPHRAQTVAFTIGRTDGRPTALQPYLGAGGHLVVLREGDLAYAHAHPVTGTTAVGGGAQALAFRVEAPGPGRYRMFLDFKSGDTVHTAAFTADAGGTTP